MQGISNSQYCLPITVFRLECVCGDDATDKVAQLHVPQHYTQIKCNVMEGTVYYLWARWLTIINVTLPCYPSDNNIEGTFCGPLHSYCVILTYLR